MVIKMKIECEQNQCVYNENNHCVRGVIYLAKDDNGVLDCLSQVIK